MPTSSLELMLRLLLAAGLGAAIGVERELCQKPAGLRTNILIALGSALFVPISIAFGRARDCAQRDSGFGIWDLGFEICESQIPNPKSLFREAVTASGLSLPYGASPS